MKNIPKIVIIITIVFFGGIIAVKNLNGIDKGYIISDKENKDANYKDEIIDKDSSDEIDNIQVSQLSYSGENKITIYISGEVNSPGVVELNSDDRLADGVSLCGGLTENANLNAINLAIKIKDESHYIIPKIGEGIVSNEVEENSNSTTNEDRLTNEVNENQNNNEDKININTANMAELDSLPGFGEVTAQKIIDYRNENSKFNSIEEIKNIKGIGDKKFNDVKDYICVQ